jgi:hypothetical protein
MFLDDGSEKEWIVDDLIRPGDQVLIAGAPKSGKSLLALQLATIVALGGEYPERGRTGVLFGSPLAASKTDDQEKWKPPQVKKPRKVLYLSLEMGERSVGARLRKQLKGLGFKLPDGEGTALPEELSALPLFHVFSLPANEDNADPRRGLRLVVTKPKGRGEQPTLEYGPDFEDLKRLISTIAPDLVILDTLIQTHQLNENSNIEMKAVMQAIRAACVRPSLASVPADERNARDPKKGRKNKSTGAAEEKVAHVIVHHMRKDFGQSYGGGGVESMRGAGSIHSEADLVLAMKMSRKGLAEVTGSARDVKFDDIIVRMNQNTLLFSAELKMEVVASKQRFAEELFCLLLHSDKMKSKKGMTASEAETWCTSNADAVANAVGMSDVPVIREDRMKNLFGAWTKKKFCKVVAGGGGRGNEARYRTNGKADLEAFRKALPKMKFSTTKLKES